MKTVAKTLLFDQNDRVLVLYRGHTHPRYAHHADFPGGEVELGELIAEAVSREIKEETGLAVQPNTVSEVLVKEIDSQLTHVVCITKLKSSMPTVNLSWEHEGYEWLTLEQLRAKVLPATPDDYYLTVLEYITQNKAT